MSKHYPATLKSALCVWMLCIARKQLERILLRVSDSSALPVGTWDTPHQGEGSGEAQRTFNKSQSRSL